MRRKATAWLWPATNPCPQLVREQVKRHIEELLEETERDFVAERAVESYPDRSTFRVF